MTIDRHALQGRFAKLQAIIAKVEATPQAVADEFPELPPEAIEAMRVTLSKRLMPIKEQLTELRRLMRTTKPKAKQ